MEEVKEESRTPASSSQEAEDTTSAASAEALEIWKIQPRMLKLGTNTEFKVGDYVLASEVPWCQIADGGIMPGNADVYWVYVMALPYSSKDEEARVEVMCCDDPEVKESHALKNIAVPTKSLEELRHMKFEPKLETQHVEKEIQQSKLDAQNLGLDFPRINENVRKRLISLVFITKLSKTAQREQNQ